MKDKSLSVTVEGTSIVVTMPGYVLSDHIFQNRGWARLMQSSTTSVEKEAPAQTRKEFEASAWEAAKVKARELGWIW